MPLLDVIMGRSGPLDEAEEELGKPVKAEEHDLALHVERCAQRWALSFRASKNNGAQLAQIRLILAALVIYLLVTSADWSKVLEVLKVL